MSLPKPRNSAAPPALWTDDECHALIAAYRSRFPKPQDWGTIASAVACRSPLSSPPKTARQCRQKMDALRKRYRKEKEKEKEKAHASLCPSGRYMSSWELFQPMFDLESDFPARFVARDPETRIGVQFGGGYRVREDHTFRVLAGFDHCVSESDEETPKGGFGVNGEEMSRVLAGFDRNVGDPDQKTRKCGDFGGGFLVNDEGKCRVLAGFDRNVGDPDEETRKGVALGGGFGVKDSGHGNSCCVATFHRNAGEVGDVVYGFPVKLSGNRNLGPLDFKTDDSCGKNNEEFNAKLYLKRDCTYGDGKSSGVYQTFQGGLDSNDAGFKALGVHSSLLRSGEEVDPIEEMASSVDFLGQVFMKMEKKKMEMAKEIVKASMEMELKQSQVIMEAQKQILNACVEALMESKTKRRKKINRRN